jgi:hypothetical protein
LVPPPRLVRHDQRCKLYRQHGEEQQKRPVTRSSLASHRNGTGEHPLPSSFNL